MDRATGQAKGLHERGRVHEPATPPTVTVLMKNLFDHCIDVLQRAGLRRSPSELVADSLVDAEARGIRSHGVVRLRIYTDRIRAGLIDVNAEPTVIKETDCSVHIDARNAIGHAGAVKGIDCAIAKAVHGAVGVAGVRNSNHCGTLAYFARRATDQRLLVIAASNAPPTMTYHGGRTRAVGTNPLAIGIPRPDMPPILLDMATSATARGKIIVAAQVEGSIPEGWAVDVAGHPTTDARAALEGSVLPFAGAKGSGLAMMIDLLCGALTGGVTGGEIGDMYEDWSRAQRVGHFFIVLNPVAWVGHDAFMDHVERFVRAFYALPPAEGFGSVVLPGEREDRALSDAMTFGVELGQGLYDDLQALAAEVGAGHMLEPN